MTPSLSSSSEDYYPEFLSSNSCSSSVSSSSSSDCGIDLRIIEGARDIYEEESKIDPEEELYLITWCPDPKEIPDADFYVQHNMNIKLLADYLKTCECGVFCVEPTQEGNPHYHGWYQVAMEYQAERVAMMKTMKRFGIVDIKKAKHFKVGIYTKQRNALWYYKKELVTFDMSPNPIFSATETTIDFECMDLVNFFAKVKTTKRDIIRTLAERKFYEDYYRNSIAHLMA